MSLWSGNVEEFKAATEANDGEGIYDEFYKPIIEKIESYNRQINRITYLSSESSDEGESDAGSAFSDILDFLPARLVVLAKGGERYWDMPEEYGTLWKIDDFGTFVLEEHVPGMRSVWVITTLDKGVKRL